MPIPNGETAPIPVTTTSRRLPFIHRALYVAVLPFFFANNSTSIVQASQSMATYCCSRPAQYVAPFGRAGRVGFRAPHAFLGQPCSSRSRSRIRRAVVPPFFQAISILTSMFSESGFRSQLNSSALRSDGPIRDIRSRSRCLLAHSHSFFAAVLVVHSLPQHPAGAPRHPRAVVERLNRAGSHARGDSSDSQSFLYFQY